MQTIKQQIKKIIISLVASMPLHAAVSLDLPDSTLNDFSKSLAVGSVHKSAYGAQSLAGVFLPFGFNVGVIGGATKSEVFSEKFGSKYKTIPNLNLVAMVGIPFGINAEINFSPKIDISSLTYSNYSFAMKWTVSKFFPIPLPAFHVALRFHIGKNTINYTHKFIEKKFKEKIR